MTSRVNPNHPATGVAVSKAASRANWAATKAEIEHGGFFRHSAAGGVERRTAAKLEAELLSAADFGAIGDGRTDNSAALIAMRDFMWSAPSTHYVIRFPPGEYHYANNRWLLNVRSYEVIGHGCTFRCTHSGGGGTHVYNAQPIHPADPWADNGDAEYNPLAAPYNGHVVHSAPIGATNVTCQMAADAGNFAAGDRVLLHGFSQQEGGYPPNPRYFEFLDVATADAGSGIVTFTKPLRFFYDERWHDENDGNTYFWGKPRLMKLERPNFVLPVLAIFRGGYWAENPNDEREAAATFSPIADTLLIEDIRCVYHVARTTRYGEMCRCHVERISEPDKLIERWVYGPGCVIEGRGYTDVLREGTGVQELVIDGLHAVHGIRPNGRQVTIRRSTIVGDPADGSLGILRSHLWAVRRMTVEDTTLINARSDLARYIEANVVESITVTNVTDGVMEFPDNATNRFKLYQNAEVGTMLLTRDGARGGKITNIYPAAGNILVEGDWLAVPQAPDELFWSPIADLSIERVRFEGPRAKTRGDRYRAYPGKLTCYTFGTADVVWAGEDVITNWVRGRIVRIGVAVDAVYTGLATTAYLTFYDDDSGTGGNLLLGVDLKVAGWREVTAAGGGGPAGADDTYGSAHIGKFVHWLSVRPLGNGSFGGLAGASFAELPKLRVIVEVVGPEV